MFKKMVSCLLVTLGLMTAAMADRVLQDTNGHATRLSELHGKWVIINYWAPWCGICVGEIPAINQFYRRLQGKNAVLFGVDFDHVSTATLQQTIRELHITYPVLRDDPNSIWGLGSIDVVPMIFFINPEGTVVKTLTGSYSADSLLDTLQDLQNAGKQAN